MNDIRLSWDIIKNCADLVFENGDIALDTTLETPIIYSLYVDARADVAEDLPDPNGSRRGYWGDQLEQKPTKSGSLLWLLERSALTEETVADAESYALDALEWMADELMITAYQVEANRLDSRTLGLKIQATAFNAVNDIYSVRRF